MGLDVGSSEETTFWQRLLRGLRSVHLVISDGRQVERRYLGQRSMRKLMAPESLPSAETRPLRLPPVH